ncbi:MAG: hypothetical protein EZS28_043579, partial [Streblomastix strix]
VPLLQKRCTRLGVVVAEEGEEEEEELEEYEFEQKMDEIENEIAQDVIQDFESASQNDMRKVMNEFLNAIDEDEITADFDHEGEWNDQNVNMEQDQMQGVQSKYEIEKEQINYYTNLDLPPDYAETRRFMASANRCPNCVYDIIGRIKNNKEELNEEKDEKDNDENEQQNKKRHIETELMQETGQVYMDDQGEKYPMKKIRKKKKRRKSKLGEPERVFALCKYQAIAVEEDEIQEWYNENGTPDVKTSPKYQFTPSETPQTLSSQTPMTVDSLKLSHGSDSSSQIVQIKPYVSSSPVSQDSPLNHKRLVIAEEKFDQQHWIKEVQKLKAAGLRVIALAQKYAPEGRFES